MLPLIGLGIGLAGAVGKMIGRGKANREMDRLNKLNPAYKENPLAAQRLGLANTLLNARAPGALSAERNIRANQAGSVANINRVATDSTQALAMASGTQGQSNEDFNELAQDETQDYQRRYQNVVGAENAVINEQDKVFQDGVRRWEDNVAFQGAKNENRQNTWSDISNHGFGLANFGMSGGFDGMQNPFANKPSYGGLSVGRGGPFSPIRIGG
jgi:hypothetical protein